MSDEIDTPDIASYPYPSDRIWFDPRLINANCNVQMNDVAVPFNTDTLIAPAHSGRWAIGFFQSSLPTNLMLSPWPDIQSFIWDQVGISRGFMWFKLFDYGPLVCNKWFCRSPGATTVRVVQIIRN